MDIDAHAGVSPKQQEADQRVREPGMDHLPSAWPILTSLRLLLGFVLFALLMVLGGMLLPQLPEQLVNSPAGSTRWLLNTSAAYGPPGELFRILGLFNLLHSTALQIFLVTISLLLLIHFVDRLGRALAARRLVSHALSPVESVGDPVELPAGLALRRSRFTLAILPQDLREAAIAQLAQDYPTVIALQAPFTENDANETGTEPLEERIVGHRYLSDMAIQPLAFLGLWLGVVSLWLFMLGGWELSTPVLAPGESYRFAPRQIEFAYEIKDVGEGIGLVPFLNSRVSNQAGKLVIGGGESLTLGAVRIGAVRQRVGLYVYAPDDARMVRPGDATPASEIGLIFPSEGSEESIILPKQEAGLRIVRVAGETQGEPSFQVELYTVDDEAPVQRVEVNGLEPQRIRLQVDGAELLFVPAMGVRATARSSPLPWLPWVALVLTTLGLAGFIRNAGFLVLQCGVWAEPAVEGDGDPESLLILQSNDPSALAAYQSWCAGLDRRPDGSV